MTTKANVIAVDLGASGGKCFPGLFDDNGFALKEIHRFSHEPAVLHVADRTGRVEERSVWNDILIYANIVEGLRAYRREIGAGCGFHCHRHLGRRRRVRHRGRSGVGADVLLPRPSPGRDDRAGEGARRSAADVRDHRHPLPALQPVQPASLVHEQQGEPRAQGRAVSPRPDTLLLLPGRRDRGGLLLGERHAAHGCEEEKVEQGDPARARHSRPGYAVDRRTGNGRRSAPCRSCRISGPERGEDRGRGIPRHGKRICRCSCGQRCACPDHQLGHLVTGWQASAPSDHGDRSHGSQFQQ